MISSVKIIYDSIHTVFKEHDVTIILLLFQRGHYEAHYLHGSIVFMVSCIICTGIHTVTHTYTNLASIIYSHNCCYCANSVTVGCHRCEEKVHLYQVTSVS